MDDTGTTHQGQYKQRYILEDKFWSSGGPIFFYTGNEGDIQWFCENLVKKHL